MSFDLVATLLITVAAALLLLTERVRADLVALGVMVSLGVTGVLTPREALSGLSSSAVVTLAAIFVLVAGLQRTGVTDQAGRLLGRLANNGERRLVAAVMASGAALSLVMNNIAAAAILLPAVSGLARREEVRLSRVLMPLAFSTTLGGMATLFTTTNIVVSGALRAQNLRGFGILDFASVGGPMAIAGILFMVFVGYRWLPERVGMDGQRQATRPDLVQVYRLGERLFRARVPAGSILIGRPLAVAPLRERFGVTVVAIERNGHVIPVTTPDTVVEQGDVIVLEGNEEDFRRRDVEPYLEILPPRPWREEDLETEDVVVVEAVLAPRSRLIGQTLRQTRFREKYGMVVLGIWRQGRAIRTALGDLPLQYGDALLLQGPRARLLLLDTEPDLIVLADPAERDPSVAPEKGGVAMGIMALTLLAAALNPDQLGVTMLTGAVAMVAARVLAPDQAYAAIEWRSVFLVAGMLPLGLAMADSGLAAMAANRLVRWLLPVGPTALVAGLGLVTLLLAQVVNGVAVAGLMAPVGIAAAQQAGLDPHTVAMAVALCSSMAFITPLGHAVNVLVMGPAGYRFGDFRRVGVPLTGLLFVVLMLVLPL